MVGMTEVMIRTTLLPTDHSQEMIERLHTSTVPYAAFGDSHVESAIAARQDLDNFGVASDNFDTVAARIHVRLSGQPLKGVILQADPELFSVYRTTADQSLRVEELQRRGRPPLLAIMRPAYRPYIVRYFWAMLRTPSLLFGRRAEAPPKESTSVSVSERDAQIRAQLQVPSAQFQDGATSREYSRLVSRLTAAGVAVCMVSFPLSGPYRRATADLPPFAAAYDWFAGEARRLGVRYLDLRALYADSLFHDPDHLAHDLAVPFTATVMKECFAR